MSLRSLVKAAPTPMTGELDRILNLPVRPVPTEKELSLLVERYTALLRKPTETCECVSKYKRKCAKSLLPLQAWALHEGKQCGGLLAAIPVGEGKTLLNLLMPMMFPGTKNWVLLVKKSLKAQLLELGVAFYGQHWQLPNIAGGNWFVPGRPVLHILTYGEISDPRNTGLLKKLNPDGIIADECHALRNQESARGDRFYRSFSEKPETMYFGWSGTVIDKSIKDAAPQGSVALKEGSPWPRFGALIDDLALQVDPVFDVNAFNTRTIPENTKWEKLKVTESTIADALLRRVRETPGFISSNQKSSCHAELNIAPRYVNIPSHIVEQMRNIDRLAERPDGEILKLALEKYQCMSQMASGFFYRWRWPRNEPLEVRKVWLEARKEYFAEARSRLGGEGKDSFKLLDLAAQRWHRGYLHTFEDGTEKYVPPYTLRGPQPVWKSEHWKRWTEVKDTCKPEKETVWQDKYLVEDAAEWARKHKKKPGVLWYYHEAFGAALQKATGLKQFGPGDKASEELLKVTGEECIIASIGAHGTGKELQMFSEALVCNVPSSGAVWEQLLGRHHRQGQLSDEVNFEVYKHCDLYSDALDKALLLSKFIEQAQGSKQKLTSSANVMW